LRYCQAGCASFLVKKIKGYAGKKKTLLPSFVKIRTLVGTEYCESPHYIEKKKDRNTGD
jgi:uncharacterized protein YutD